MNILTGIADEAGASIETQIAAHQELGWHAIELRLIDGKNISADLSDDEFKAAAGKIEEAGLRVTSFASAIGNWSRKITDDFSRDVIELRNAIPRMHYFGTRFIRTMSWVGEGVADEAWRDEVFRRYRELARIAADGGVFLAHENCTGWAGQSARHTRELLDAVASPNVVVLFDIGNTVGYGYDTWEYYQGVKDLIRYVHIKDARKNPEGGPSSDFTYPGEGDARVAEVLSDLLAAGYDGIFAIEPHVASIVHKGPSKASPEEMYRSYITYARKAQEVFEAAFAGARG